MDPGNSQVAGRNTAMGRRKGRPRTIDRDVLRIRRDNLLDCLERAWPEFGWSIEAAVRRGQALRIAHAFAHLAGTGGLEPTFAKIWSASPVAPCIRSEISQSKRKLSLAGDRYEKVNDGYEKANAAVAEARAALAELGEQDSRRMVISEELDRRRALLSDLQGARSRHYEEMETARGQLMAQERYYCREQISAFLGENRGGATPESIANAVAGLPLLSCRHSFEIMKNVDTRPAQHRNYLVFLFFNSIRETKRPRSKETVLSAISQRMNKSINDLGSVEEFLKTRWSAVEAAVEQIEKFKFKTWELPYHLTFGLINVLRQGKSPLASVLREASNRERHDTHTSPKSQKRKSPRARSGDA